jgi:hypothetical protein
VAEVSDEVPDIVRVPVFTCWPLVWEVIFMVGIIPTVAGTLEERVSGLLSSIICAWALMLGSCQTPVIEPALRTDITTAENNVKKRLKSFKFFLF